MRLTSLLVAVCLGLLAMAGCGGGISKDEFVKKANAICKKGSDELSDAASDVDVSGGLDKLEEFMTDTAIPNIEKQIENIRDLGFPDGDKAKLEGILEDAGKAIDEIKKDPGDALSGGNPFADVNEGLQAYGLDDCGSSD